MLELFGFVVLKSFSGINSNYFCLFMALCLQLLLLGHILLSRSSLIAVGFEAIHFSEASDCCGRFSVLLTIGRRRISVSEFRRPSNIEPRVESCTTLEWL